MFEESQSIYVSLAHRYWNPRWSAGRNREVYGRNASPDGVGSNLRLEATLRSQGPSAAAQALQHLKALCDHRCLHTDVDAFRETPSTLENITVFLGAELSKHTPPLSAWERLTVYESESLSCTIRPGHSRLLVHERAFNLTLTFEAEIDPESGLACARGVAERAVRAVAAEFSGPCEEGSEAWARRLFAALQIKVKTLVELRIDLGGHQTLRISSTT